MFAVIIQWNSAFELCPLGLLNQNFETGNFVANSADKIMAFENLLRNI